MRQFILCLSASVIVGACSQSHIDKGAESLTVNKGDFNYVSMDAFNPDMAQFIGLGIGESFETARTKINTVFKAYDGHAVPQNIGMKSEIVEAGWKQVLVTQDGVMDGTVTGQQLLAIFDEDQKLITYGMRIKCYSDKGDTDWQKTVCE